MRLPVLTGFLRPATLLTLIAVAVGTSSVQAGVITIDAPSANYTAGQTFDVTLEMPDVTNLFAYEVSLILTGDTGVAGVDYFFVPGVLPPTDYVFPSLANRAVTTAIDSPTVSRLTVSDIDFSNFGTDVVAGVNDHIATVQVMTAAGYSGNLELSIDLSGLFLDDSSLSPVAEYNTIVADTLAAGPLAVFPSASSVVPEPSTAMIALLGCATTVLRRKRKRGSHVDRA